MRLGAHCSTAGGLEKALVRAQDCGCEGVQIFTKNGSQWQAPLLREEEIQAFRKTRAEQGTGTVLAHASYLINLCQEGEKREKSLRALLDEIKRCEALGIDGLVLHPGSRGENELSSALSLASQALSLVLKRTSGFKTKILLENTAGQGKAVGASLIELERIIEKSGDPEGRLRLCLDTCHAFAAGYPLHKEEGYAAFLEELKARFGLGFIEAFHFNDSRREFFSRVDRHSYIGGGKIGLWLFWKMLRDPALKEKIAILETPPLPGRELHESFAWQLKLLRRLAQQKEPPPQKKSGELFPVF